MVILFPPCTGLCTFQTQASAAEHHLTNFRPWHSGPVPFHVSVTIRCTKLSQVYSEYGYGRGCEEKAKEKENQRQLSSKFDLATSSLQSNSKRLRLLSALVYISFTWYAPFNFVITVPVIVDRGFLFQMHTH